MANSHPITHHIVDSIEDQTELKCDTKKLGTSISGLGEIGEVEVPVNVPRYATCQTSIVVTREQGGAPDVMYHPIGVAIHEDTHQIFIADSHNDIVKIFSETGEFLYQLGGGQLSHPCGIATYRDSVYVSCLGDNTVSKFSMTELCRVRRIGGRGTDNGRFDSLHQLAIDSIGRVFIADTSNNRICIHDPDLNHLRNITHQSMSQPYDVTHECLYVLCPHYYQCILVLTLEGNKLHTITSRGMDVCFPFYFCLDSLNNFVISDFQAHSIRVFTPEGNLLHRIGRDRHHGRWLYKPSGLAITPNGRLVCMSISTSYCLKILY